MEGGNILFLILLAVVLFAALSYAVTQSMRGGGKDASTEKYEGQISDMLNYLAQIDGALTRMRLAGGLKPEQISFAADMKLTDGTPVTGSNGNTACQTAPCLIFTPTGGGIAYRSFRQYASQPSWWGSGWGEPGAQDIIMVN